MTLSRRREDVLAEISSQLRQITALDSNYPKSLPGIKLIRWEPDKAYGKNFGSLIASPSFLLVVNGNLKARFCDQENVFKPGDLISLATDVPESYEYLEASAENPFFAVEVTMDDRLMGAAIEYLDEKYFQYITDQPTRACSACEANADILTAVAQILELCQSELEERIMGDYLRRLLFLRILTTPMGSMLVNFFRKDRIEYKLKESIRHEVQHLADKTDVANAAALADVKQSLYHHYFKDITGMPPGQFKKWLRVTEARRLMIEEGMAATQACYKTGYENLTYFIIQFKQVFGYTPGKFIQEELQTYPWQQQLIREGYRFK